MDANDQSSHPISLSKATVILHWVVAVGMIGMLIFGLDLWLTPSGPAKNALIPLHKSFGVLVGASTLLRLALRIREGFPSFLPATLTPREKTAARATHISLLFATIALPLTGMAKSLTYARPVAAFGYVIVPQLLPQKHDTWHEVASWAHVSLAAFLTLLIIVHVAAALRHHLVLGDETLRRITRLSVKRFQR